MRCNVMFVCMYICMYVYQYYPIFVRMHYPHWLFFQILAAFSAYQAGSRCCCCCCCCCCCLMLLDVACCYLFIVTCYLLPVTRYFVVVVVYCFFCLLFSVSSLFLCSLVCSWNPVLWTVYRWLVSVVCWYRSARCCQQR